MALQLKVFYNNLVTIQNSDTVQLIHTQTSLCDTFLIVAKQIAESNVQSLYFDLTDAPDEFFVDIQVQSRLDMINWQDFYYEFYLPDRYAHLEQQFKNLATSNLSMLREQTNQMIKNIVHQPAQMSLMSQMQSMTFIAPNVQIKRETRPPSHMTPGLIRVAFIDTGDLIIFDDSKLIHMMKSGNRYAQLAAIVKTVSILKLERSFIVFYNEQLMHFMLQNIDKFELPENYQMQVYYDSNKETLNRYINLYIQMNQSMTKSFFEVNNIDLNESSIFEVQENQTMIQNRSLIGIMEKHKMFDDSLQQSKMSFNNQRSITNTVPQNALSKNTTEDIFQNDFQPANSQLSAKPKSKQVNMTMDESFLPIARKRKRSMKDNLELTLIDNENVANTKHSKKSLQKELQKMDENENKIKAKNNLVTKTGPTQLSPTQAAQTKQVNTNTQPNTQQPVLQVSQPSQQLQPVVSQPTMQEAMQTNQVQQVQNTKPVLKVKEESLFQKESMYQKSLLQGSLQVSDAGPKNSILGKNNNDKPESQAVVYNAELQQTAQPKQAVSQTESVEKPKLIQNQLQQLQQKQAALSLFKSTNLNESKLQPHDYYAKPDEAQLTQDTGIYNLKTTALSSNFPPSAPVQETHTIIKKTRKNSKISQLSPDQNSLKDLSQKEIIKTKSIQIPTLSSLCEQNKTNIAQEQDNAENILDTHVVNIPQQMQHLLDKNVTPNIPTKLIEKEIENPIINQVAPVQPVPQKPVENTVQHAPEQQKTLVFAKKPKSQIQNTTSLLIASIYQSQTQKSIQQKSIYQPHEENNNMQERLQQAVNDSNSISFNMESTFAENTDNPFVDNNPNIKVEENNVKEPNEQQKVQIADKVENNKIESKPGSVTQAKSIKVAETPVKQTQEIINQAKPEPSKPEESANVLFKQNIEPKVSAPVQAKEVSPVKPSVNPAPIQPVQIQPDIAKPAVKSLEPVQPQTKPVQQPEPPKAPVQQQPVVSVPQPVIPSFVQSQPVTQTQQHNKSITSPQPVTQNVQPTQQISSQPVYSQPVVSNIQPQTQQNIFNEPKQIKEAKFLTIPPQNDPNPQNEPQITNSQPQIPHQQTIYSPQLIISPPVLAPKNPNNIMVNFQIECSPQDLMEIYQKILNYSKGDFKVEIGGTKK
ncbi:Hypothetical_protein [Hexamita inflata]|uniref:Hypothetical_protein n=1 Tax=Hexamita inflata TaxID=28002 RepID=A0AA86TVB3_9EUKA|nr:Hypothetical protein HINF_LOCUS10623 [Hexamita inflata]